jgi:signal transduction histidine kinase
VREIVRRFGEYGAEHRTGTPVSLDHIVTETVALIRPSLPSDTTIIRTTAPRLPLIQADRLYAHQVITNLLLNASEALKSHCGEIEIILAPERISTPRHDGSLLPSPGNYVRLTVKDDGVGMNDATRIRIFDEFFTTKAASRGTGLGLSIVREIMRESGGGLAVESAPDRGTSLHIYWRVAAGEHVFLEGASS